MDLQLAGLRAVVTGGSSGIGAAIVRTLAAEGCTVAFCGRDRARIESVLRSVDSSPGLVSARALDIRAGTEFKAWLETLGSFDIFIPNASAISIDWDVSIETDIRATVATTEAALVHLAQSPAAAITYVGSKAASLPSPNAASYGAAKAAMAHYMKSMAVRLLPSIRVNTVSPGDTAFPGSVWDSMRENDPSKFQCVVARNPMGRLATPDEIARVVAFISSPVASFVAGANWYVDGGAIGHVQF